MAGDLEDDGKPDVRFLSAAVGLALNKYHLSLHVIIDQSRLRVYKGGTIMVIAAKAFSFERNALHWTAPAFLLPDAVTCMLNCFGCCAK